MNRITVMALFAFLVATGCSNDDDPVLEDEQQATTEQTDTSVASAKRDAGPLISKTVPYPASYSQECQQNGTVVEVNYTTQNYVDVAGGARQNNAYVYLPYGYRQNNQKYNVLYLIHSHYGNASTFLNTDDGELRKVLDNMIANGDIDPLIVVTPSYNYGTPTPNYVDADPYCKALTTELENDLVPLIDRQFQTWGSREHRAIGGFSMGGVTTWYALELTPHLFSYYMPMSGDSWALGAFAGMNRPAATAEHLASMLQEKAITTDDFYIWAASGTNDSAYRETLNQIEGMNLYGEPFTTTNLTFHEKDGARHEYLPMVEYVYNALPLFFPKNKQQLKN